VFTKAVRLLVGGVAPSVFVC